MQGRGGGRLPWTHRAGLHGQRRTTTSRGSTHLPALHRWDSCPVLAQSPHTGLVRGFVKDSEYRCKPFWCFTSPGQGTAQEQVSAPGTARTPGTPVLQQAFAPSPALGAAPLLLCLVTPEPTDNAVPFSPVRFYPAFPGDERLLATKPAWQRREDKSAFRPRIRSYLLQHLTMLGQRLSVSQLRSIALTSTENKSNT